MANELARELERRIMTESLISIGHFVRENADAVLAALRAAEPSDTGDFVRIPVEAYEFLMGQGPLEGCQFGEWHPDRPGEFWWRVVIQEREAAEPSEAETKIEAIRAAMRRYLPPDSGITAEQFASEVIGIVDGRK